MTRIGSVPALDTACEQYLAGRMALEKLELTARQLRKQQWEQLRQSGAWPIYSNDQSWHDRILDMCMTLGVIPARFRALQQTLANPASPELYFAMAYGYHKNGFDIEALKTATWADGSHQYLVPEFEMSHPWRLLSPRCIREFLEARNSGVLTQPLLTGPVTFLLCGNITSAGISQQQVLQLLLPLYGELLQQLQKAGATEIAMPETEEARAHPLYDMAYSYLRLHTTLPLLA
ncbi:uroporphyrinogen decarboxylase/cobalamine-independent methonine synthase family protein [Chitinophaga vietnamensis]|uniref:hypothetical protein n=1 Tax=Chitinophaga vietnamensis TaxID=2593957 RepID=UPI0011786041|nr:hypothetical protein [Chitinophaga vietnamensis]